MSTHSPRPQRPELRRPVHDRYVAGVCAGVAAHLRIHPNVVRLVMVALTFVAGSGVLAYALLWVMVPEEATRDSATPRARRLGRPAGRPARSGSARKQSPATFVFLVGLLLLALGVALLLQVGGLNLRLDLSVPLVVVGVGAAAVWSQLDASARQRWRPGDSGARMPGRVRVAAGLLLAVFGLIVLTAQGRSLSELADVTVAALTVIVGVALIAAPYGLRLWQDLRAEQAERVRTAERADIAAHLHDSVLQTLALIQRNSDNSGRVTSLARAQERELRTWLYGGQQQRAETLASMLRAAAIEVEEAHGVVIEVVVTGDRDADESTQALVGAAREAMVNAARHGSPPVTVYSEVGATGIEVFVRDHGEGFDLASVPHDRLGVRESIMGRMHRQGGSAELVSRAPTEVRLQLPLAQSATDEKPAAGHNHDTARASHNRRSPQ